MLGLVPDHLKTKKVCKHAVKKLPFVIKCVLDRYKTQQMYDKVILKNGGMLVSILDHYKDQHMCNKAVDNYPHALWSVPVRTNAPTIHFVPDRSKTQEMCDKAVNPCSFVTDFVPDWYIT